jgi:hypothetical protein
MDVSGQIHPLASTPAKQPIVPIWYTRLGGPRSLSGRGGEEKKSLLMPGMESRSSSP